ncbi:MAG TPA: hypothetical protein VFI27_10740 [candidate division Zixibacteria bacterium]|nr:hypothetical protein [candidate division Zixibacteria bacterium]
MRRKIPIIILVMTFLLLSAVIVYGFTNNGYQLSWWSVDGGGGVSTGDDYLLQGTVGQHDAGDLQGGSYSLAGGYWQPPEREPDQQKVMLPLLMG